MEYKYSTVLDKSIYETQGLCQGIDLRRHTASDLVDLGAFRAQEDWKRLVGPLLSPYKGSLGPKMSFMAVMVPECLPERLEVISYATEFGFLHDDVVDSARKEDRDTSNDELLGAMDESVRNGQMDDTRASGKRHLLMKILKMMTAIDPPRAKIAGQKWADFLRSASGRQNHVRFDTLEEYIPYRRLDGGSAIWQGLVTFGCAITIPEDELSEADRLSLPAFTAACLANDLLSFDKEAKSLNSGPEELCNAIWIIMKEQGCTEEEAKELCKDRLRKECADYLRSVKLTLQRTDISDELKRYVSLMQYTISGNLAWSIQCPRYNENASFTELQLLRGTYGLENYPIRKLSSATNNNHSEDTQRCLAAMPKRPVVASTHVSRPPAENSRGPCCLKGESTFAGDLNMSYLNDEVILQPYQYLASLPSKGVRQQFVDALGTWLQTPNGPVSTLKNMIDILHGASLMLDDLEDGSMLRRGQPSTHSVYGAAQTINSATYQNMRVIELASSLSNPASVGILVEGMKQLFIGQSYDLHWTYHTQCPSMADYLRMVDGKTGGLFRLLTKLMVAESPPVKVSDGDELLRLCSLFGRFFQIRDDYQNLVSANYEQQKGFAEDLDEGKYSFTLVHCIKKLAENCSSGNDERGKQLQALLLQRKGEGRLCREAKHEILHIMREAGSFDYTVTELKRLRERLMREVGDLEARFGKENIRMRWLLDVLEI